MDEALKQSSSQTGSTSACGIDCSTCVIKLAPSDPSAAVEAIEWFRQQGWLKPYEGLEEVIERKMYCCGCKGSRDTHWSSDCFILNCCVDRKGLEDCSCCEDFPCADYVSWSRQSEGHARAFELLKSRLSGRSER